MWGVKAFVVTFALGNISRAKAVWKSTGCNSNGQTEFLDRHPLDCGASYAMTDWYVDRCGHDHFLINYNCELMPVGQGGSKSMSTPCDHAERVNIEYLDRFDVSCPAGTVLQEWAFNTHSCVGDHARMDYECATLGDTTSEANCAEYSTGCNHIYGVSVIYLDRHRVKCPAGKYMKQWRMGRNGCGGNDQRFKYTCCDITTQAPTPSPTPNPTPKPTEAPKSASMSGDPHMNTWAGEHFEFHGACDLVLLDNPNFANGLGMKVHVRTKQVTWWSFIESAVLMIGDTTLEVMGGDQTKYWINGEEEEGKIDTFPDNLFGFRVHLHVYSAKQHRVRVDLDHGGGAVSIETYNKFVRVNLKSNVHGNKKNFVGSKGLMGSYPEGTLLARDGTTVMTDINEFGNEWQVLASEPMLFHSVEGPQHPQKCTMPTNAQKRRLGASTISWEDAKKACAKVHVEERNNCETDVIATNDLEMAGSYLYSEI